MFQSVARADHSARLGSGTVIRPHQPHRQIGAGNGTSVAPSGSSRPCGWCRAPFHPARMPGERPPAPCPSPDGALQFGRIRDHPAPERAQARQGIVRHHHQVHDLRRSAPRHAHHRPAASGLSVSAAWPCAGLAPASTTPTSAALLPAQIPLRLDRHGCTSGRKRPGKGRNMGVQHRQGRELDSTRSTSRARRRLWPPQ